LSDCTPEGLALETLTHVRKWSFLTKASSLTAKQLLIVTSDDVLPRGVMRWQRHCTQQETDRLHPPTIRTPPIESLCRKRFYSGSQQGTFLTTSLFRIFPWMVNTRLCRVVAREQVWSNLAFHVQTGRVALRDFAARYTQPSAAGAGWSKESKSRECPWVTFCWFLDHFRPSDHSLRSIGGS